MPPQNRVLEMDIGNSAIKCRYRTLSDNLVNLRIAHDDVETVIADMAKDAPDIHTALIASVAEQSKNAFVRSILEKAGILDIRFAEVKRKQAGVLCGYSDLSQLGIDRWLAVLAASNAYNGAIVALDAGSAITLDFVNSNKEHIGGYIVPGLSLMREALKTGTNIPPERNSENYKLSEIVPGRLTSDAIGVGRYLSIVAFVNEAISQFESQIGASVSLICTGGDALKLIPHLKQEAVYEEHLVLDGLAHAMRKDD